MNPNLLVWQILLPLVGVLVLFPLSERLARPIAIAVSLAGVVLAALLWISFNPADAAQMQGSWSMAWFSSFPAKICLGIDGLSLPLVVLTKIMMPIALLASWKEARHPRALMSAYLLLDAAMTGAFLATDVFLFYVFWEAMLIPMLLLIGVWGSKDRIYAALKFFLFTFAGSIFLLAALIYLMVAHRQQLGFFSTDLFALQRVTLATNALFLGLSVQDLIFWGLTLAFLIKIPLFPFHTWLPDAHVQAPTGGSILLAAVLLKLGAYGLLRFSIPIATLSFYRFAPLLSGAALVGIVYGAWVAYQQTDMKKLVAYSSVSHLAFVVLGINSLTVDGLAGGMLQMINHGISTGALFFLVGVLYERRHTRNFSEYGGLASVLPWFSFFLVLTVCSSMGVPGLNGFVGEFLVLLGTFERNPFHALIAVSGIVFGAVYLLVFVRKVLFGPLDNAENKTLKDLLPREWAALLPLALLMVVLGLAPYLVLDRIRPSLERYWSSLAKPDGARRETKFGMVAPQMRGPQP